MVFSAAETSRLDCRPASAADAAADADALNTLCFDNRFVAELPADPEPRNFRRQVPGACYSLVAPTPVRAPKLAAYAREVAELLDLPPEVCEAQQFTEVFAGNRLLPGMTPYATNYGGHQFGHWAGQLGDGRAINLGEVINKAGQRWVLQLKGAGPTPYARRADGLAVLRSSLREFLCSEAMFHLGVPTTRALSLVLTGETVERDMFYDGHPRLEPGAVVCRVAPSFTRFGNFQIFAARGEEDVLRRLMAYTLRTDFPELGLGDGVPPSSEICLQWFEAVCERTMEMIVHWMRVGFVHGVMNTDNMSVLGLTIDYGPYGWLEDYDPHWTPNTTDAVGRRYRFGYQPRIALWNLAQLAGAIVPLVGASKPLEDILGDAVDTYQTRWQTMTATKLGLSRFNVTTDLALITELLNILAAVETDMTIFFRRLARVALPSAEGTDHPTADIPEVLLDAYYRPDQLTDDYRRRLGDWLVSYGQRVAAEGGSDLERTGRMRAVNPKYVLRNYLAQEAIDLAEKGDFSRLTTLLELLRHPYDSQPEMERFAVRRPEWARHRPGCSMLSCSS
ncbi:MAG: YdiU family protein [Desulfosarcinaceae bacterium]